MDTDPAEGPEPAVNERDPPVSADAAPEDPALTVMLPALALAESPVKTLISPDAPSDTADGVEIVTDPVEDEVLEPPAINKLPPAPAEAKPPVTDTAPPAEPVMPSPPEMCTAPPLE
jgi:hypothetical protein